MTLHEITKNDAERAHGIVRLRTTFWGDNRGLHMKKSIVRMQRMSVGHDLLNEDVSMSGASEVFPRIVNLDECEDGLYEVVTCNIDKDLETGNVEDYDYRLIPKTNASIPRQVESSTVKTSP